MAQLAFRATCQRDHDLETFTDRKAFEAHMTKGHKARKPSPAKGPGSRKGGLPAKYLTPNRAPKGTEGLTEVLLENRRDVGEDWTTDERVGPRDLKAGDVFELQGMRYKVQEIDPERGWHLVRLDNADRRGWLQELKLRGEPVETVVIVKRAA